MLISQGQTSDIQFKYLLDSRSELQKVLDSNNDSIKIQAIRFY